MTNDQIGIILKDIQSKTDLLQTEVMQNGVIIEDIQSNVQRLAESMGSLKDEVHGMKANVDKIPEMADDIKAIKAVLTDHSAELKDHKTRIKALEPAAV